jgi:hypothetical protein
MRTADAQLDLLPQIQKGHLPGPLRRLSVVHGEDVMELPLFREEENK